jgi:hypothetical protein
VADRVELPAKARIVGGMTIAKLEIECGTLGSQHGVSTNLQLQANRTLAPVRLRGLAVVHAGVKINVTGAILDVGDDLPSASFWRLEGDVIRLDGLSTVQDMIALAEATDRRPTTLAREADEAHDATEAA